MAFTYKPLWKLLIDKEMTKKALMAKTGISKSTMEIQQEMIRLINQTRKANGVSELPVNEALMNAAQACSDRRYTWHHAPEESKAAADAGLWLR